MPSQHVHYHLPPATPVYHCTHRKPPKPPPTHYHCTPCQSPRTHRPPTHHASQTPQTAHRTHRLYPLTKLLSWLSYAASDMLYNRVAADKKVHVNAKFRRTMEKLLYKDFEKDLDLPKLVYWELREALKVAIQKCLVQGWGGVGCKNLEAVVWAVEGFAKAKDRQKETVARLIGS